MVKDTPAAQLADAVRRVHAGLRVVDPALATDCLVAGESPLTQRETEVLRAARDGSSVAAIAQKLFLSEGTVRNHLSAAIGKTGASQPGRGGHHRRGERLALSGCCVLGHQRADSRRYSGERRSPEPADDQPFAEHPRHQVPKSWCSRAAWPEPARPAPLLRSIGGHRRPPTGTGPAPALHRARSVMIAGDYADDVARRRSAHLSSTESSARCRPSSSTISPRPTYSTSR